MVLDNRELYARSLLNGKRWDPDANKAYVMPRDEFDQAFGQNGHQGNLNAIQDIVARFVARHYLIDAPRITKLQRYYLGDNDIHYWVNDKKERNHADNRIASGFAKFITNMRVGYMLGKPIQFKLNDESGNSSESEKVDGMLKQFNLQNDEQYHEKVMKTNLSTTGRAYELLYAGESKLDSEGNSLTPEVKMRAIDPATAFVVYDTSIDRHSLFGVRYYTVDYNSKLIGYVDVYTSDRVYHFKNEDGLNENQGGNYQLIDQETTSFDAVPLTEYINNENRTGDWEAKLDEIDAYDLAMSEMANSEEDFANSKLMLSGDIDFSDRMRPVLNDDGSPVLDDDGNPVKVPIVDTKDPYILLKPSIVPDANGGNTVVDSRAEYLTKQLDETGWETFINHLSTDIHKDTNTPNTTDEAFSGQSSGVALMYKLFGEDQERSMQESLYSRGLNRRLSLLGNFWKENREITDASIVQQYQPYYTPNLPRNNADIVNMAVQLNNTGLLSDQTLREILANVTGVSADAEEQRLDDEREQDPDQNTTPFDGSALQGVNPVDLAEARQQAQQEVQPQPESAVDFISRLQRGDHNAK